MEKSRASAREAVSSRWATRAEASLRVKQSLHAQNAGVAVPVVKVSSLARKNDKSTVETNANNQSDNFIHTALRQIQHSLGLSSLQQLDQGLGLRQITTSATKASVTKQRIGNTLNSKSNSKSKKQNLNSKIRVDKVVNGNSRSNGNVHANIKVKTNGNINTKAKVVVKGANGKIAAQTKTLEQKSINKAKNAEMLANTLTQMRVTTALQAQLESITSRNKYHDDEDEDDDNNEEKDENNIPNNNKTSGRKSKTYNYLRNIISILPAGFDESSALINSIQHRKRAFFLLDFGQVIKSHAIFLSYTCGFEDQIPISAKNNPDFNFLPPTHRLKRTVAGVNSVGKRRKGIYIQPQFSVTKNPNIELLKLLVRLGVDLRCNSSDDIMTASQAIREERRDRIDDEDEDEEEYEDKDGDEYYGDQGMVLVDDASKTRKPNGYFRKLLQTRPGYEDLEVAVDDVDEVKRISNTIRQLAMRYPNQNNSHAINREGIEDTTTGELKSCRFMLRLPPIEESNGKSDALGNGLWEALILNVHSAAKDEGGELFGVSVDLSEWSQLLATSTGSSTDTSISTPFDNGETKEEEESKGTISPSELLHKICTKLRLFRLLLLSVGQYHIRIDLTGLPTLSRMNCDVLTRTLSNVVSSPVTLDELCETLSHTISIKSQRKCQTHHEDLEKIVQLANNPATCSLFYTADLSTHLVARSGALCARIIGSKVTAAGEKQQKIDMLSSSSNSNGNDDGFKAGTKEITHYFIDDGCYGSLGSSCTPSSATPRKHTPVPLYGNRSIPKSKSHLSLTLRSSATSKSTVAALSSSSDNQYGLSTVWGPTCDGLDKVCQSVVLPKDLEANRDWLVFSNLGCGGFGGGLGLGTAFNGFEPPDVEYCVLGYFSSVGLEVN